MFILYIFMYFRDKVVSMQFNTCLYIYIFIYFRDKVVSMQFMRKYLHVAKALQPALSREASDVLAEQYATLRSQDGLQHGNTFRVRRRLLRLILFFFSVAIWCLSLTLFV